MCRPSIPLHSWSRPSSARGRTPRQTSSPLGLPGCADRSGRDRAGRGVANWRTRYRAVVRLGQPPGAARPVCWHSSPTAPQYRTPRECMRPRPRRRRRKRCCKSVPVTLWSNSSVAVTCSPATVPAPRGAFQHVLRTDPAPVRRSNTRHAAGHAHRSAACCSACGCRCRASRSHHSSPCHCRRCTALGRYAPAA